MTEKANNKSNPADPKKMTECLGTLKKILAEKNFDKLNSFCEQSTSPMSPVELSILAKLAASKDFDVVRKALRKTCELLADQTTGVVNGIEVTAGTRSKCIRYSKIIANMFTWLDAANEVSAEDLDVIKNLNNLFYTHTLAFVSNWYVILHISKLGGSLQAISKAISKGQDMRIGPYTAPWDPTMRTTTYAVDPSLGGIRCVNSQNVNDENEFRFVYGKNSLIIQPCSDDKKKNILKTSIQHDFVDMSTLSLGHIKRMTELASTNNKTADLYLHAILEVGVFRDVVLKAHRSKDKIEASNALKKLLFDRFLAAVNKFIPPETEYYIPSHLNTNIVMLCERCATADIYTQPITISCGLEDIIMKLFPKNSGQPRFEKFIKTVNFAEHQKIALASRYI
jgi:hypothetical protein